MGLKKGQSRSSQDDVNAIVTWAEKVKTGASNTQLGKKLGCTRDTVRNRLAKCRKLGLELDYTEIVQDNLIPKTLEAAEDLIDQREPSIVRQVLAVVLPSPEVNMNLMTQGPEDLKEDLLQLFARARARAQQKAGQETETGPESPDQTDQGPGQGPGQGQGGATNEAESGRKESLGPET